MKSLVKSGKHARLNWPNGFRYDHALVSQSLDQLISKIEYNLGVRAQGLSDHSLLLVDLDL